MIIIIITTDIRYVYKGIKWFGTLILNKAKRKPLKNNNTHLKTVIFIFFFAHLKQHRTLFQCT